MTDQSLPEGFRDLNPHLGWALPTERERSARRQASTITALTDFYTAMLPRMEEVLPYLAQFPVGDTTPEVTRLLHLALALAEVAPAVENFGQASVIEGYDVARFVALHE
jgi:hypothetical protein